MVGKDRRDVCPKKSFFERKAKNGGEGIVRSFGGKKVKLLGRRNHPKNSRESMGKMTEEGGCSCPN